MEYLLIWLIAIVVFAALEAATYQMICIWFAVGSIGAFLGTYAGVGFNMQMIIFILLSVICLVCFRPLSIRFLKKNTGIKTNVDALVGKEILITKDVDNIKAEGEGKVNGLPWTVRSADDSVKFEAGEIAYIERVEGVKLIVRKRGN